MGNLMDMLGGTILLGFIALVILQLNTSFVEANYNMNVATATQENLVGLDSTQGVSTSGFMRNMDFYVDKMGYNVGASAAITTADSSSLVFNADLWNNDTVRTVTIGALPGSSYTNGGNTAISKWVYLYVGSTPNQTGRIPVSQFALSYFDSLGKALSPTPLSVANAAKVRSVLLKMAIESRTKVRKGQEGKRAFQGNISADTTFKSLYVERMFSPKGLRTIR